MKRRLGILGAGSAGILSSIHFCTWLDDQWDVVSIHNPAKKILGIGESTNGGFVGLLQIGTQFSLGLKKDLEELDATLKFGSKFVNWRKQEWINPLLDGNTAIHFNNFTFKRYAYPRLARMWPQKFKCIEGEISDINSSKSKVTLTIDGVKHHFDYVLDCTGFPQTLDGYAVSGCSPVNRCLIHSVGPDRFTYEPYTDHIAHENGWMFGVPLQSRKTFGYLFNDNITDKSEAVDHMKRILGVTELDAALGRGITTSEYSFKCYYTNKMIDGRVGKNGNKALFFEPLIANSIFLYIYSARLFYDFIVGNTSGTSAIARSSKQSMRWKMSSVTTIKAVQYSRLSSGNMQPRSQRRESEVVSSFKN